MLRADTECLFYSDGLYNMLVWTNVHMDKNIMATEVRHAFRILRYLGAPSGFSINWWRIPVDRKVSAGEFPNRASVNGGWARRGFPEVYMFRLEEWDRVLIHECIHALNWDLNPSLAVKTCLEQSLNGKISEALFEAATELNAEWLWCIVHSPDDDYSGQTWLLQTQWQQQQAYSILARQPAIWSEDTSVFAYYILKAVLALDMKTFLVSWLTNTEHTEYWCSLWSKYKPIFMEKARNCNISEELSMRMTNPAIDKFIQV